MRRAVRRTPVLMASVGGLALTLFVVVPLAALVARVPWSSARDILAVPAIRDALRLSLWVSLWALVLSMCLGFPIAWLLARVEFPGRPWVRALVTLPMVLPPVVGGVALLVAFGRRGLAGQWLDRWFDIQLAYTTPAAVMAATFVSLPFFVVTVEAALVSADRRYEEVGRTLGASPGHVLRRVTLPQVRGAIGAGSALAWARALGEFGATLTFAGSFEGRTRTMPLAINAALATDVPAAMLLSLVLLAVSVTVLATLHGRWLGAR